MPGDDVDVLGERAMRFAKVMAVGFVMAASGVVLAQTNEAPNVKWPPRRLDRETVTPWFHEEQLTSVHTAQDGTTTTPTETRNMTAEDSQGRYVSVSTNLKTGLAMTHVHDPVKGVEMAWSSAHPVVKVLHHPVPVPGRESCWKVDNPPVQSSDEAQMQWTGISCPPAEHQMPVGECEVASVAVPSTRRPEMHPAVGEAECEKYLAGGPKGVNQKIEDLGESYVAGWAVHGCRVTTESQNPKGPIVHEVWITGVPPENTWRLPMRLVTERPLPRGEMGKVTLETEVFRNGDEPDETMFEPPKGYEMKVLATTEVSCDSFRRSAVKKPAVKPGSAAQ